MLPALQYARPPAIPRYIWMTKTSRHYNMWSCHSDATPDTVNGLLSHVESAREDFQAVPMFSSCTSGNVPSSSDTFLGKDGKRTSHRSSLPFEVFAIWVTIIEVWSVAFLKTPLQVGFVTQHTNRMTHVPVITRSKPQVQSNFESLRLYSECVVSSVLNLECLMQTHPARSVLISYNPYWHNGITFSSQV